MKHTGLGYIFPLGIIDVPFFIKGRINYVTFFVELIKK